jgi:alginate O-acetyltransferase complex protein AlgI
MTFSSAVFLFLFLPTTAALYYAVPSQRAKNILLAAVSVLFYAFGEPVCVLLLLASVAVNGFLAVRIERGRSRLLLAAAVTLNLLLLGVFKYAALAARTLNLLPFVSVPVPAVALPIGISFYTFQILSYVVDVYRGEVGAHRDPVTLLLYISFFPQLIAGPIVKYHDIRAQLDERPTDALLCAAGIRRFLIGLSKKLLLANACGRIADAAFGARAPGTALAWLGAFAYCLQIYHDFSGYSDMAIGLGKMFGFALPENFNYPYCSGSIKEFWRRWHVSLSAWFREYLYIPLGGNRRGRVRTACNKFIVFFATGLWHGASLNFILWGLWHGAFSSLEEVVRPWDKKWLRPLWRIVTLAAVLFGFVLFRAETLPDALAYAAAMFTAAPSGSALAAFLNGYDLTALGAAILFSMPVLPALSRRLPDAAREALGAIGSAVLLAASVAALVTSTFNPFIYFRF